MEREQDQNSYWRVEMMFVRLRERVARARRWSMAMRNCISPEPEPKNKKQVGKKKTQIPYYTRRQSRQRNWEESKENTAFESKDGCEPKKEKKT